MDQIEIFAVVFQVAANAVLPVWILHSELRVIAMPGVEASCNFLVAIQALKGWRTRSELMATSALCSAAE